MPPRLGKDYDQHPTAAIILEDIRTFGLDLVTFWGIGLTNSDIDLTEIYRNACSAVRRVEFINPDAKAYENATTLLGKPIVHYPTLEEWLSANASTTLTK